ncbi:MAG TPA: HlyD family secretion protein [Acidiferrobacteraceae bacterium]|nr:HlyD family secretion protein [Acidiferrobacteraceae bacterium]
MALSKPLSRALLLGAALLLLIIAFVYWEHAQKFDSTDDAYVGADVVRIAAQVNGPVTTVWVHQNQPVAAGARLFRIDPAPYALKVRSARARLAEAEGALATAQAQRRAVQAALAQSRVGWHNAQQELARTETLARVHYLSAQALEHARAQAAAAKARLRLAQAQARAAALALSPSGIPARVQAAQAALKLALLERSYTTVRAPAAGVVSALTLRPGSYVTAGSPLFALIEQNQFWVDANFKETDLAQLRVGQPARISVDMYPDVTFRGVVQSLGGAAGTAFSLLPPENATGNWVKVTQRVPVRIRILRPRARYPLRIGTSASVTVRIRR